MHAYSCRVPILVRVLTIGICNLWVVNTLYTVDTVYMVHYYWLH